LPFEVVPKISQFGSIRRDFLGGTEAIVPSARRAALGKTALGISLDEQPLWGYEQHWSHCPFFVR
jgi:hypothetical protein